MRSLFSYRTLAAVLLVPLLLGCGRSPELVGIENPEIPVESVAMLTKHRIFIATTREQSKVAGELYSANRSQELGLASVDVTIPPNHVTGSLERPKKLPPDPRTEFTVVDPLIYSTDPSFITAINRELATRPKGKRNLLIFIHGFNNTTSDSILRLSQFVEDTEFSGVPVLFSWASAAKATRYVYDLNSVLVARVKLKEMAALLAQTNAEGVDILGHSMGTLLTMEGLVDAQLAGKLGNRKSIDHIILASSDVDIDLFRTQIGLLPEWVRNKMFVFISKDDKALRISRLVAGGVSRVGATNASELEKLGVTVIDLSEIDDSSSGSHSKFAGSPEVVQFIGAGLKTSSRFGTDSTTSGLGRILRIGPNLVNRVTPNILVFQ